MTAPFPYFGGKRRVAAEVWRRFGDVRCYVEPFFGSGAVLLARPQPFRGVETANDLDGLLCNFWRALQADPAGVAAAADWPVSECDLHARHLWLVERRADITERLCGDPEWYDVRAAGWWVWGACCWIGSGWCSGKGPWVRGDDGALVLGDAGRGINRQLPHLGNAGRGINRQLPHLGNAGLGINRQLPHLGDAGRGINRKLPHLGDAGRGINRKHAAAAFADDSAPADTPAEWLAMLSKRLRGVRIACGSWGRVTGDSVLNPTRQPGHTAVFLDPPYDTGGMDYSAGGMGQGLAVEVRAWAVEAGKRTDMRIALCGYDEHDEMASAGWSAHLWKTKGGYSSQGAENANQHREVVWFSPACLGARQPGLFDAVTP